MEQNDAQSGQEVMPESNQVELDNKPEQPTDKPATMESLLEAEGLGIEFPKPGEIKTGVIASIGESEILVSIGTKSEGVIPAREIELLDEKERGALYVGNTIPVYVVNPEDPNGNVLLSYIRAREERDWQLAESLLQSGEAYQGEVIGYNKGGLIVPMGQLRGFIPASQVSVLRQADNPGASPDQRWGEMVGEQIQARVIEVDRERHRLILSERIALQETRESLKDRLLDEVKIGDVRTGRVTSLADFGAFVNIEGADGLVHLSEICWERISHPRETLKIGQEVKVKVITVDQERKRIGLSIRQLLEDPWMKKVSDIKEGQLIEGTITHLTKFGAFARLGDDLEGLIHISELSEQRIAHPKEVVNEGEVLTLRVFKIDPERHRIGLSLRRVDSPAYTDLDWKTTLAEVVQETKSEADVTSPPESTEPTEPADTPLTEEETPSEAE